jgi:hypothetical protein
MIVGGGPGELLYIDGTDFRQIALRISSDIPYPNRYGSWRDYVISSEHQLQPCVDPSTTGGARLVRPQRGLQAEGSSRPAPRPVRVDRV